MRLASFFLFCCLFAGCGGRQAAERARFARFEESMAYALPYVAASHDMYSNNELGRYARENKRNDTKIKRLYDIHLRTWEVATCLQNAQKELPTKNIAAFLRKKARPLWKKLKQYEIFLQQQAAKDSIAADWKSPLGIEASEEAFSQKYFAGASREFAYHSLARLQMSLYHTKSLYLARTMRVFCATIIRLPAPFFWKKTRTVKLGETYTAECGIIAGGEPPFAVVSFDAPQAHQNQHEAGALRFTPTQTGKQTWKGKITYLQAGKPTTIEIERTFEVVPKNKK